MQSDFRRLMSEIDKNNDIKVIISDENLYNDLANSNIEFSQEDEDGEDLIVFDPLAFQNFQELANGYIEGDKNEEGDWKQYTDPMEPVDEMSTSSAAGAYNASLHATPKQYKGPEFKEDVNSGYKKVKGFRPGHTKLSIVEPKDLWNLNEREETEKFGFKIGDKVEVIRSEERRVGKECR